MHQVEKKWKVQYMRYIYYVVKERETTQTYTT